MTAKMIAKQMCKINRIGETRVMKNGLKVTITDYKNYLDINLQFEDGIIVKHKRYDSFLKGSISHPNYKPHIDETRVMKNGLKATITDYKNYHDIDIQFEDGIIVKHKQYDNFLKGYISHPNYKPHIGESRVMNNGLKATIIAYRRNNDIDIQFEDETIVKHKQYDPFLKGYISHPNLSYKKQTIFHDFETKFIVKVEDTVFYKCKCLSCGLEDILTPQQMITHEKEHLNQA